VVLEFLYFFFYPGAFAEFKDQFSGLSSLQQLKIYCAGSWHNLVLAASSYVCLLVLPIFLFPFYYKVPGVAIADIERDSILYDSLHSSDVIISLADCKIASREDWRSCFDYLLSDNSYKGFCSSNQVKILDPNLCCDNFQSTNSSILCFVTSTNNRICASGREVANGKYCKNDGDCEGSCFKPVLQPEESLIKITLINGSFVLLLGHPFSLYYSLPFIVDVLPRQIFWFLSLNLPLFVERFLSYLMSISAALGFLNLAPIFYLDGAYATNTLIQLFFPSLSMQKRNQICKFVFSCTSLLLISNLILSFFTI